MGAAIRGWMDNKISDLIVKLTRIMAEHGDLPLMLRDIADGWTGVGRTHIQFIGHKKYAVIEEINQEIDE